MCLPAVDIALQDDFGEIGLQQLGHLLRQLATQTRFIACRIVRQRQVQALTGNRRLQAFQLLEHAQLTRQRHTGIALVQHIIDTAEQQHLQGLGQARQLLNLQRLTGKLVELLTKAVVHQCRALLADQIGPAAVGK